jgi:hypothetical protein
MRGTVPAPTHLSRTGCRKAPMLLHGRSISTSPFRHRTTSGLPSAYLREVLTSLALPDSAVSATDLNRLTASPHSTALWLWLRSLSRSITIAWERRGRGRGRAKDGTLPPPPFVLAPKPPRRSWHEDVEVPRRIYSRSSQLSTRNLCIRRGMGKQSKPLIYFHLFP